MKRCNSFKNCKLYLILVPVLSDYFWHHDDVIQTGFKNLVDMVEIWKLVLSFMKFS